jgi:hypothetical protein
MTYIKSANTMRQRSEEIDSDYALISAFSATGTPGLRSQGCSSP